MGTTACSYDALNRLTAETTTRGKGTSPYCCPQPQHSELRTSNSELTLTYNLASQLIALGPQAEGDAF